MPSLARPTLSVSAVLETCEIGISLQEEDLSLLPILPSLPPFTSPLPKEPCLLSVAIDGSSESGLGEEGDVTSSDLTNITEEEDDDVRRFVGD